MGNLNKQANKELDTEVKVKGKSKLPTALLRGEFVKNAKPSMDVMKNIADSHNIPLKKIQQWFATRRYQEKIRKRLRNRGKKTLRNRPYIPRYNSTEKELQTILKNLIVILKRM